MQQGISSITSSTTQQNIYLSVRIQHSLITGKCVYVCDGMEQLLISSFVYCRRLFHFYTFFLLFYYMLVGLFKAIQRIIISAALNLLYLSRLDIALTVTGWEWLDKGIILMDLCAITVHFFSSLIIYICP